MVLAKN
ncbi:hypothetical protein YPPY71_2712, partial [Yersinia pestis PY-71]